MFEPTREVVVDTETTGLDPANGHRLVEIACVEVFNYVQTGASFHAYINPERNMPFEAFNIHGLSAPFLQDKPLFETVAAELLQFIGASRLVIHNAEFDMRFINFELKRAELPAIGMDRVFDTLALARKRHPGASNSLDALCARYKINSSKRIKHGALVDAELLAEVYAELTGGRQTTMSLSSHNATKPVATPAVFEGDRLRPLPSLLSDNAIATHRAFIRSFTEPMIWAEFENQ